jgi:hypothetical protein
MALVMASPASPSWAQGSEGRALMIEGQQKLLQADENTSLAAAELKQGNKIRKQLGALRYRLGKTTDADARVSLQNEVNQHMLDLENAQSRGAGLRESAGLLKDDAMLLLRRGMAQNWPKYLQHSGPLSVQSNLEGTGPLTTRAHNIPQRSVHPRMPAPRTNTRLHKREDMTLEVSALNGQTLPSELDSPSFSISRTRSVVAHIESHNGEGEVPLNQLHEWRLILSTLDGLPVENALITFSGHMPGHVHGLPTQPLISATAEPGVYRVAGVKFQMGGWWVIDFAVQMGAVDDSLRFNVLL